MKRIIVTTTIHAPTKALRQFAKLNDWHLVVVGDKKTPSDFRIEGATYLSPADQEKIFPKLSDLLGWNCIQRRNIGFAYAAKLGAELVATVDDDNVPKENWGKDIFVNRKTTMKQFTPSTQVFDPLAATEHKHLWHRGFPIQDLATKNEFIDIQEVTFRPDIQANFWDGDPDVDAICRMEHAPDVAFSSDPFPFAGSKWSPFNSQNTVFSSQVLPDYFMFPEIGRMDDIWGSYFAQSVGWLVGFGEATVNQVRNDHDLTNDFEKEVLGYTSTLRFIRALSTDPWAALQEFLPKNSLEAFTEYRSVLANLGFSSKYQGKNFS